MARKQAVIKDDVKKVIESMINKFLANELQTGNDHFVIMIKILIINPFVALLLFFRIQLSQLFFLRRA
jgi:hypothetical protein